MSSIVLGANMTKAADPIVANILAKGVWGGDVKVMIDTYEASGLTSGSTLKIGQLPQGAKVIAILVVHDALGSSVTLAAGNNGSGQSAIYAAAASASSATTVPKVYMLVDKLGYVVGTLSGDDIQTLTVGGASATGTINTAILYTVA